MASARTRILCTVGPACASVAALGGLLAAGAGGLRINGAHTPVGEVGGWVRRIRDAARREGVAAAVLLDLPGTKLRVGRLAEPAGLWLAPGAVVALVARARGAGPAEVPVRPFGPLAGLGPGARVLLDDGRIEVEVRRVRAGRLDGRVVRGGRLATGKGVDAPGRALGGRVPTAHDRRLLAAGLAAGIDLVALSFVRRGAEVRALRRALGAAGRPDVPIVAKVERVEACERLPEILAEADAALVARGDLGVDAGPERVPALQREIVRAAGGAGRPVLLATELLESMIERARPTRAEVSDVAHAVLEGVDAVMLSGETAVGRDPARVVRTLDGLLREAEQDPLAPYAGGHAVPPGAGAAGDDAHVARAAVELATRAGAFAIAVYTRSGASAVRLSKERPRAQIRAFVPDAATVRRLALAWGVRSERLGSAGARRPEAIAARLRADPAFEAGRPAVLVMGGPDDPAGSTRLIRLLYP